VGDKILMLGDGNAELTKAMGLELDASGFGLGTRGQRFSMVVDNGVVKNLNIEEGGAFEKSKAEVILEQLG
jgi:peroxiredoxin